MNPPPPRARAPVRRLLIDSILDDSRLQGPGTVNYASVPAAPGQSHQRQG